MCYLHFRGIKVYYLKILLYKGKNVDYTAHDRMHVHIGRIHWNESSRWNLNNTKLIWKKIHVVKLVASNDSAKDLSSLIAIIWLLGARWPSRVVDSFFESRDFPIRRFVLWKKCAPVISGTTGQQRNQPTPWTFLIPLRMTRSAREGFVRGRSGYYTAAGSTLLPTLFRTFFLAARALTNGAVMHNN